MVFHNSFDCFKGFVTDIVLDLAGILSGNLLIYPKPNEESGENLVALINFFSNLKSYVGKEDISVLVYSNKSAIFKQSYRAADTRLGKAHMLAYIY